MKSLRPWRPTKKYRPGPVDARLRTRAEAELKEVSANLPLTVNDVVLSFLNYFQTPRGTAIVETGLRRAGRYREMIERVLREEGLPTDLIHLAQAESAFQPQALSRAGARGLWQFMSFRGTEYGLQRTWWLDERQDPEPATRAAARHLRDLYAIFGDWYLVMAAYNSGPGAVQRAIERTGYADFWELYKRNVLPRETRNYVPIILALTLIAKDPQRYGIQVEPDAPVRTDTVRPGHPIDLRLVAETIDTDLDTLRMLNPQLLRLVTPPTPDFMLRLPEGTAEHFTAEIAMIPPDKWVSWRQHRVADGDTLSAIAKRYRVTTTAIADANGLDATALLPVGQKLIIPASQPEPAVGKLVRYTVRRGDTLASIGDEFGVTVVELRRWNGLRSTTTRVNRGVRLRIYPGGLGAPPVTTASATKRAPATPAATAGKTATVASASPPASGTQIMATAGGGAANSTPVVHRVQRGETLWSIAQSYRTTVESCASPIRSCSVAACRQETSSRSVPQTRLAPPDAGFPRFVRFFDCFAGVCFRDAVRALRSFFGCGRSPLGRPSWPRIRAAALPSSRSNFAAASRASSIVEGSSSSAQRSRNGLRTVLLDRRTREWRALRPAPVHEQITIERFLFACEFLGPPLQQHGPGRS